MPGLKFVVEEYTKDELRKRILGGQKEIVKLDPKGLQPPLYMPAWGNRIGEGELNDLVEYLMSLLPKSEQEKEGFLRAAGARRRGAGRVGFLPGRDSARPAGRDNIPFPSPAPAATISRGG